MAATTPARGQCELARLTASDAATIDFFGNAVALSGGVILIGSYQDNGPAGGNQGSVYLFAAATELQLDMVIASDDAVGDLFGNSVAMDGSAAVIGAPWNDDGGSNSGSAYLFNVGNPSNAFETFKLIASDDAANDEFGSAVAISGGLAVVAAWHADAPGPVANAGAAYVFDVATGQQRSKLIASDAQASDEFAYSVAMHGNIVLIGSHFDDDDGNASGSVYVFDVSNPLNPVFLTKITASDAGPSHQFGSSVAIHGNTAVVGAEGRNAPEGIGLGGAYVFDMTNPASPVELAILTASDAATGDRFGCSAALRGGIAVIGARLNDDAGSASGSAYVFVKPPGGWITTTETTKLTASDAEAGDDFGFTVAVESPYVLVGARADDVGSAVDAGSAYLFELGCTPTCCAGDFNSSNSVTPADISIFVSDLLAGDPCPVAGCCPGDLNADAIVDGRDLPGFVAKLLGGGGCP